MAASWGDGETAPFGASNPDRHRRCPAYVITTSPAANQGPPFSPASCQDPKACLLAYQSVQRTSAQSIRPDVLRTLQITDYRSSTALSYEILYAVILRPGRGSLSDMIHPSFL